MCLPVVSLCAAGVEGRSPELAGRGPGGDGSKEMERS